MRRGQKSLNQVNDFKFGIFIGCFLSDGAAGLAVKGSRLRVKISYQGSPCSFAYRYDY